MIKTPPKLLPFITPKVPIGKPKQQLPERKRMTLIAAFSGAGGTVLMADSQETTGYAKKSVTKIEPFESKPYRFALAGAGNATHIEAMTRHLCYHSGLNALSDDSKHADVERLLKAKVLEYYQTHIWPRASEKPEMEFIFLAQPKPTGHALTFHITDGQVNFCQFEPKAIGIGAYLADYLLPKFEGYAQGVPELLAKAVYILKEVKENIEGCGGESQIYFFTTEGNVDHLSQSETQEIEAMLDLFDNMARRSFDATFDVDEHSISPESIASEIRDLRSTHMQSVKNREQRRKRIEEYWSKKRQTM
jgi:20S proteasome alpha/beta subunit